MNDHKGCGIHSLTNVFYFCQLSQFDYDEQNLSVLMSVRSFSMQIRYAAAYYLDDFFRNTFAFVTDYNDIFLKIKTNGESIASFRHGKKCQQGI